MENDDRPIRKSPRATFHDYSSGRYFVTICTDDRQHFFGFINNDEMHKTQIGELAEEYLRNLNVHYPYAIVNEYVIMPNHIHAIIDIIPPKGAPWCVPTTRSALSVVVGGFKQSVTMFARRNNILFNWQNRYHDHIIRGPKDCNRIVEYIQNNVHRWDSDCFNI